MSWTDAGNNNPVDNVSERYFLRSSSRRASYSYFFFLYYSSFFAY